MAEEYKNAYIDIIDTITDSNQNIISKFLQCINNPYEYYQQNYSNYEVRGITKYTNDNQIMFLGMIDLLINEGYFCELDWKVDLNSFTDSLQYLKRFIPFDLTSLNFEDNIAIWCDTINKEWQTKNRCLAEIIMGSDSYVLFVCPNEKIERLSTLAKAIDSDVSKIIYKEDELKKLKNDIPKKDSSTKISKYLDDFTKNSNKMRDKLKDEIYWKYILNYTCKWISKVEGEFEKNLVNNKQVYRKKLFLRNKQFEKIMQLYSAGYNIESCKIEYQKLLELASSSWTENTGWGKLVEYIALGVLLGVNKEMVANLKKMISSGKHNNDLIQFFMSHLDENYNCEVSIEKLPFCYRTLEKVILRKTEPNDSLKLLEKYLEKEWCRYNEDWQENAHESLCYDGYWSLEIAAIAKILKLDDECLKKFRYYPYDLVHFDNTISVDKCQNDFEPEKINSLLDIYTNLNNIFPARLIYENNTIIWYKTENERILITNANKIIEEKRKIFFKERWKLKQSTKHDGDFYQLYLDMFEKNLK